MTAAELWRRLPYRKRAYLIALDIYVNQQLGGDAETVSARLARSRARGEWAGTKGCEILDGIDPGHCDRALRYPTGATE